MEYRNFTFVYHNTTNSTVDSLSSLDLSVWFITTIIVAVLGSVLITFLLTTLFSHRQLRTSSGICVANYMFIELMLCAVETPLHALPVYFRITIFNCTALVCSLQTFNHANNWAAVLLAVNRFIALVYPYRYTKSFSRGYATIGIPMMWMYIFLCSIPFYSQTAVKLGYLPSGACSVIRANGSYFFVMGSLNTYLPIGIMGILYAFLFCMKNMSVKVNIAGINTPRNYRRQRRLQMIKVLFLTFVINCLCLIPVPILNQFYPGVWRNNPRALLWTRTLAIGGYALNPLTFFMVSGDYRRGAKRAFGNWTASGSNSQRN
ncbi:galanin receptor 2a-like [Paramacrobiotus metropolitanus]|uniref:galanin receptor 2a-like n=1 Tax=Paramacrobiotus metropolitanus TaxID=2943436 RepID=UPI002445EEC7|nr:galanin receptor 2a-like [Paramacrobiotus metropolitanus]